MGYRTKIIDLNDTLAKMLKKEIDAMSLDVFFNLIIESEKDVLNGHGIVYEGLKKELQPVSPSEYN